jgi:hypothetical protein
MLTMKRVAHLLAGLVFAAAVVVAIEQPAQADYIYCPPVSGPCYIIASDGGSAGGGGGGGSGGGGAGGQKCFDPQLGQIPCYRPGMGWFNSTDGCYFNRLSLPADDPAWQGHDPANGFVYNVYCWDGGGAGWVLTDSRYLTSPPPGYGGGPTILELAVQAINRLPITGPAIQLAPKPAAGSAGLVGLPVWMWSDNTAATWGPATASASAGGVTVTATARAQKIVWSMGDGGTVDCASTGTPYRGRYGNKPSPTCGYLYTEPSRNRPGGRYPISATTTWEVTWSGGGESGVVTVTRSSTSSVRIDEMQVVTQ